MGMIIGVLIGAISFGLLYERLDRSGITLLEPMQKRTRDLKNKKVWQYSCFLIVATISMLIVSMLGFAALPQGLVVGIILSLNDVIFEDSFFDKLRNTLR